MRLVAHLGELRDHRDTHAVQKAQPFVANGHRLHLVAGSLRLAQLAGQDAQHVGVHAATQALVGGHDDKASGFGVVATHEGMRVLRVGLAEIGRDVANLVAVGASGAHPLLRFAHFGGGHHFHGFGDLFGVFHRFDLASDFLACCHMSS